jgi:L-ascorbate metabolism protein UlaG (beta-lactamase superfamily)
MKVKWLGHSAFKVTSDSGTSVITDPYSAFSGLSYGEIKESADVVTISHEHGDHNNAAAIQGNPELVKEAAPVEKRGIKFNGISTYHDDAGGSKRGGNTIFCFEIDGIRVCHLGDLGHPLGDKEAAAIGEVDVVLTPVGGFFTIDAGTATGVCDQLAPKVIIPMHFKNDKCAFPISAVDDFLEGKTGVNKQGSSEVEFKKENLPATTQIVVLEPAL